MVAPYNELEDPIAATMAVMENGKNSLSECDSNSGCPLNNLVQEMSSIDEGFRNRLNQLTSKWVETVAASFERAKVSGLLKPETNSREVAGFVISVFEGSMGQVKCAQSFERLEQNGRQLLTYLNPLRQSVEQSDRQAEEAVASLSLAKSDLKKENNIPIDSTHNILEEKQG